jgi:sec-independent protein translocase protein TatB
VFNIGPGELIAICMVALLVLGPERLPGAVRTVGRVVGELRRISGGFQNELRNAFEDSEIDDLVRERRQAASDLPDRTEKPHTAEMQPVEAPAEPAAALPGSETVPETAGAGDDGEAAPSSTGERQSERDSETEHDTPPPSVGGTPPPTES